MSTTRVEQRGTALSGKHDLRRFKIFVSAGAADLGADGRNTTTHEISAAARGQGPRSRRSVTIWPSA